MRIPKQLPGRLESAPFTWQEALDAGITRQRWRHPGLDTPSRGIRSPAPERGQKDRRGSLEVRRPGTCTRLQQRIQQAPASANRTWAEEGADPIIDKIG